MKILKQMLVTCAMLLLLACNNQAEPVLVESEQATESQTTENSDSSAQVEAPAEEDAADPEPVEANSENSDGDSGLTVVTLTPTPAEPDPTPEPEEVAEIEEVAEASDEESPEDASDEDETDAGTEEDAAEEEDADNETASDSETVEAGSRSSLAGTVANSGARVYSAAGSATTILTTLPAETDVIILSISSNRFWAEVDPSGFDLADSVTEAWIPLSQLADLTDEEQASLFLYAPTLTANLSGRVRLDPSTSAPVLTSLEEDEGAKILGINGDSSWYQIEKDDGKIGWISASIVTLQDPDNLKGIARFNPGTSVAASPPTATPVPVAAQPAAESQPVDNNNQNQAAAPAPTAAPVQSSAAAPPAAPRPGDLYYSNQNGAFAGAGRIDAGSGNAQRGGCRGMTWTVLHQLDGIVHVGSDLRTNPYAGDATCDQAYPILCIFKSGGNPPATSRPDLELNYYNSWSGAQVLSTGVVSGNQMPTLDAANKICADTFGSQYWQMAEFHDGNYGQGGWDLWATGTLPLGARFWVSIDDQRANPWNSQ